MSRAKGRNEKLLRFMGAIQSHIDTLRPVTSFTDFEGIEVDMALSVAERQGFISYTGMSAPMCVITPVGEAWVRAEMQDFLSLIPIAKKG